MTSGGQKVDPQGVAEVLKYQVPRSTNYQGRNEDAYTCMARQANCIHSFA